MARKASPPASNSDVPAWFMTYSDVITLMMTFFILLLTFATSQPEKFDLMRSEVFGFGGRMGVAGNNREGIDREAIVIRYRPRSSRITSRGSEIPMMYTDPLTEAVGRGLSALDQDEELAREEQVQFEVAASLFINSDGSLTAVAKRHLGMLATQMQRLPLTARLEVTHPQDITAAVKAVESLSELFQIHPGRLSVAAATLDQSPPRLLKITITKHEGSILQLEPAAKGSANGHSPAAGRLAAP